MPDAPPKIIQMRLEELLDPDFRWDDPDAAGENPTAYVLKTEVDECQRQRDQAVTALRQIVAATVSVAPKHGPGREFADVICRKAERAIAECEGEQKS